MTLRDTIHERAKQLRLSAYDIARAIYHLNHEQWIVSCDHMQDYLNGTKDMTGSKLDAVLSYLGIRLNRDANYRPACPRDTDGDGNCGQRYCPYCRHSKGEEHADNQDVSR